jgi:pimeloyl-ACP methyl ester carboxylesterase
VIPTGISVALAAFRFVEDLTLPSYEPDRMPLHREVYGSGPRRLVLVHGLTGSLRFWKTRIDLDPSEYSILMVDLLGFGQSPKPSAPYSLKMHADTVIRVMKEEGFYQPQTLLVGHSLGTLVVSQILDQASELSFAAVLLAAPIYRSKSEAQEWISNASLMHKGMVNGSHLWHLSCHFMDTFKLPIFMPLSDVPFDVHVDAFNHNLTSLSRTLQASIIDIDSMNLMRRVAARFPLLFLHNPDDDVAPIANVRILAEQFPMAQLVDMGLGGHNAFLKAPNRYWQALREWRQLAAAPVPRPTSVPIQSP